MTELITTDTSITSTSTATITVGISACLMGQPVRYNGGHSQSKICLHTLNRHFDFKPFCPEVAAGFGTPRPTMRLTGNPVNPKLTLSDNQQQDLSAQLIRGFEPKLPQMAELDGYILMKNSPSCGMERIKVYQDNGYAHAQRTKGLFAAALQQRYPLLPIEEEGRLHDPCLRENFITRVFTFHNFRHEVLAVASYHKLLKFHSSYKYLLMAHSQVAYRELGRLLSDARQHQLDTLLQDYIKRLMEVLSKPASRKGHTNALMHVMGYLKTSVASCARQNIVSIIHRYRQGQLPLITPMTLLKHYIEQEGNPYIRMQRYLQPYPDDLCLQNHV